MSNTDSYQAVAHSYADGVRVLLVPAGVEAGDRGGPGPMSFGDLADQAEKLLPVSEQLTEDASVRLTNPAPAVRTETDTILLAKALTDLEIRSYLLKAAEAEQLRRLERSERAARTAEPYPSKIRLPDQQALAL